MNTLQLNIRKDESIRNIQEKFSDLFPGLQIKIFKHLDDNKNIYCQDIMLCPEAKMNEINPLFQNGMLMVNGSITVSVFEKTFFNKFGLFAQVFRKNGNAVDVSCRMINFLLEKTSNRSGRYFPAYAETF